MLVHNVSNMQEIQRQRTLRPSRLHGHDDVHRQIYVSLPKLWTEDLPIVDHSPHYPQPDDFNKSNWKTLPRIIKENQVTYHTEDDDLPLNIFSPSLTGKAPVVVYVHGGSLLIGGASSYDGHDTVQRLFCFFGRSLDETIEPCKRWQQRALFLYQSTIGLVFQVLLASLVKMGTGV